MFQSRDIAQRALLILWHSRYLFLTIVVIVVLASTYAIMRLTPLYVATAVVDVSLQLSPALGDLRERGQTTSDPLQIQTEVDVLKSDQIARFVIQSLRLGENPAFVTRGGRSPPSMYSLVQTYHSLVTVSHDEHTTLASISAVSPDPQLAAEIANTHANLYLKQRPGRKLESAEIAEIKLISPAEPPTRPFYPRKPAMILGALAFSAVTAAAIVIGRKTSALLAADLDALSQASGLPVIASTPLRHGRSAGRFLTNLLRERVRRLGDTVARAAGNKPSVIAIVSSLPEEGKSRICFELGACFADAGHSTLLIDADFRKPSLLALAKSRSDLSLETPAAEGGDRKAPVAASPIDGVIRLKPNLDLMQTIAFGLDVHSRQAFKTILEEAKTRYRFILIDTPPLAVIAEASALAALADQTLFLSRGRGLSQRMFAESLAKLKGAHAPILGLVYTGQSFADFELRQDKHVSLYYSG